MKVHYRPKGSPFTLCGIRTVFGASDTFDHVDCKSCIRSAIGRHLMPASIDNTHCGNCGNLIEVQIFKNTGYCSEDCRKALAKEI